MNFTISNGPKGLYATISRDGVDILYTYTSKDYKTWRGYSSVAPGDAPEIPIDEKTLAVLNAMAAMMKA